VETGADLVLETTWRRREVRRLGRPQQHPADWLVRTGAIAATWDVDTIVAMIRADFERLVTDAAS
jgi:hypothetical protein